MLLSVSKNIFRENIYTGNFLVSVSSPLEFRVYEDLIRQYLPVGVGSGFIDSYVVSVREGSFAFFNDGCGAFYRSDVVLKEDVMALVSRHAEYLFQRNGCYSVHSGGVVVGGEALLLAGRVGVGKTSLTLELAKSGYGVLSTDRVLIKRNEVISGSHYVNSQLDRGSVFGDDFYYVNDEVRVGLLVYPFLRDASLQWRKLAYPENITRFANQIFYFLDEFPRLLVGSEVPFVTPSSVYDRGVVFDYAKDLVKNLDCYVVSGRKEEVAKWIRSMLR